MNETDMQWIRLHRAVLRNNQSEVQRALAEGLDVNIPGPHHRTPLHTAARHGLTEIARLLIARGAQPDLFVAAGLDDVAMAEDLLAKGADPNVFWEWGTGERPLHWSAQNNSVDMAGILLDSGADVDVRDGDDETPLMIAARHGSVETAGLLLTRGACAGLSNNHGFTALRIAATSGKAVSVRSEMADLLISHGAVVDLAIAAAMGYADIVRDLLREGAEVNAEGFFGVTLLHVAAGRIQPAVVELLIASGADVNAQDDELETPLHHLALAGKGTDIGDVMCVAQILLKHGADVNAEHRGDDTPLGFALRNPAVQPDLVDLLRDRGARDSNP